MYYMTGTDRRPSNHGGSSLMLLPVAAAGLYQVSHSSEWRRLYMCRKGLTTIIAKWNWFQFTAVEVGSSNISNWIGYFHRGRFWTPDQGRVWWWLIRVSWCRWRAGAFLSDVDGFCKNCSTWSVRRAACESSRCCHCAHHPHLPCCLQTDDGEKICPVSLTI